MPIWEAGSNSGPPETNIMCIYSRTWSKSHPLFASVPLSQGEGKWLSSAVVWPEVGTVFRFLPPLTCVHSWCPSLCASPCVSLFVSRTPHLWFCFYVWFCLCLWAYFLNVSFCVCMSLCISQSLFCFLSVWFSHLSPIFLLCTPPSPPNPLLPSLLPLLTLSALL